jgi:phage terminase large subunit-like protein
MANIRHKQNNIKTNDRATRYALNVISGQILAGPFVKGACQRHLNDLLNAGERGFYYDEHAASEAIAFFETILCLNGGQYEGKPFLLLPWQDFIVGSIFGWKRKSDNMRRFRVAFIETAKGSGKSPLCAGTGIKGLCADGEARAEIYAAATFKDQAMVLFRDACAFYDQSPELQHRLSVSGVGEKRWSLAYPEKHSFFRVIASDTKVGHSGPRPHMALLDEIHEHKDGNIIEMLRAGFKFRQQPLSFMITNSGHDKTSVGWEYHDLGTKVALEQLINDEFFSYICALDEEDLEGDKFLHDESLWIKVNPSLDAGLPGYDYIRGQVKEAQGMPSKMATIKRLCFCQWTEAENPAIGKDVWFACENKNYPDDILLRRRCWGGLDLSAVNDLTALALLFEPGYIEMEKINGIWKPCASLFDPFWRLKVWFWIPGIGLVNKSDHDRVPYIAWRDAGHIKAIDRKTIEYEFVIPDIAEICGDYNVQKIAYDRWNFKNFEKELVRLGVNLPELVEFGQGYQSMSPAIKTFETKLIESTIRHDGNPCLTWNAANVVAIEDAAKNKKYDKSRSTGRIDGIIASVMASGIIEQAISGFDERAANGQEVIRTV